MISTRIIPATGWPEASARFHDLSFEQTRAYAGAAAGRIGGQTQFCLVQAGDVLLAACAARIKPVPGLGRGIAWIPSGPLILPKGAVRPDERRIADILRALRAEFVDRQGHILRLRLSGVALQNPETLRRIAAESGYAPTARTPAYRSIGIDLSRDPETILMALNGKWRTDLRFAQKSGLDLVRGNDATLQARFLAMFETIKAAKGFRPDIAPQFHFPLGATDHGSDYGVEILIACKDGQDLAGIVVGTAGQVATYLFGATTEAGRPLRAGYSLAWQAIGLAQSRKLAWYDLGGVDATANPDVARFKDRMNGTPLFAEPFEARPKGALAALIGGLEALRSRLKQPRPEQT